jgi:hypothetical protein
MYCANFVKWIKKKETGLEMALNTGCRDLEKGNTAVKGQ